MGQNHAVPNLDLRASQWAGSAGPVTVVATAAVASPVGQMAMCQDASGQVGLCWHSPHSLPCCQGPHPPGL